jgi:hypothetical protein
MKKEKENFRGEFNVFERISLDRPLAYGYYFHGKLGTMRTVKIWCLHFQALDQANALLERPGARTGSEILFLEILAPRNIRRVLNQSGTASCI